MMQFQVFLSLWSVISSPCIDEIPKVAKSQTQEIFFIKVKSRPRPIKQLIQTCPHMSTS